MGTEQNKAVKEKRKLDYIVVLSKTIIVDNCFVSSKNITMISNKVGVVWDKAPNIYLIDRNNISEIIYDISGIWTLEKARESKSVKSIDGPFLSTYDDEAKKNIEIYTMQIENSELGEPITENGEYVAVRVYD